MTKLARSFSVPSLFLVFVVPFLVVVYFFVSEIQRSVAIAESETNGVVYSREVRKFVESVQRLRAVLANPADVGKADEAKAAVGKAITGLDAVDRELGVALKTSERWMALKNRWRDVQRAEPGPGARAAQDALVSDAIALVNLVGDTSTLILDPDLDTYYLMDATVTRLPLVTEQIEQTRLIALEAAARQASSGEDRNQTIMHTTAVQDGMGAVERGMKVAFQENSALRDELNAQNDTTLAVNDFLKSVREKLKIAPTVDYTAEEVTKSFARPVAACFALHDTLSASLERLLAKRIARLRSKTLAVEGFALLALLTAASVFWMFDRGQRARLRTERELRESELLKGAILKSSLDCIITMDLEGNVIEFNPAAEKTFGYRREDAIGKELAALIVPPALREMHRRGLNKFRETGEGPVLGQRIEIPAMHADGHEFMVELAITPIRTPEATVFTAYLRDISERRRAAEDLRAAKEAAETANLAKSDFLANMSHEIRTPMNGVIGTLGLLQDSEMNPRQHELAKIAQSSADALLSIINDILDYSKIEAGKLVIEPVPFDLQTVVEEVAEIHAAKIEEKGLDLIVRYEPSAPRRVVGDAGRIRQVISNLVSNAVKFTAKGHVLINVEAVAKDATKATLKLSVEDTGIGIPADKLPLLFTKFTQADASTTRRFGGTGLGLAICKHLVEAMGGEIDVVSFAGRGSVFSFRLSMPLHDRVLPGPQAKPSTHLAGVRVLIVDDNEVNRRVLDEQIKSWGMRNGGSAMPLEVVAELRGARAAGDPYRIVILDHQMPGMNGEELARAIKAEPDLRDTVLIMLTSMGYHSDLATLQSAGISACLVKPVRQSQLMDALANAWAGHPLASQPRREPAPARSDAPRSHSRVLVVDDNATNQKVAALMLEELNCRVDLAANGREAVEMHALLPYDVVFMDCEMPEMDGFEATAAIRQREAGGRRVPIIAMTAKAMQGDRDRCLAAGMDDYISKPVMMDELERTLDRHNAAPAAPKRIALDPEAFGRLLRIAHDDELQLRPLFDTFFEDAEKRVASMREGFAGGNGAAIASAAHGIRGGALNLGAKTVAEIGERIEALCRPGPVEGAVPLIEQMVTELAALRAEVDAKISSAPKT